MKRWLALFSMSGREICDVSEAIGRYPDMIISDNMAGTPPVDRRLYKGCSYSYWLNYRKLSREDKLEMYRDHLSRYDVITLHGWMNIVPAEICNEFEIYNGHPGLITEFPELRGKDPQQRLWDNIDKYPVCGSVVHRVTAEVDCGDVVTFGKTHCMMNCISKKTTYETLRGTSLLAWKEFLGTHL